MRISVSLLALTGALAVGTGTTVSAQQAPPANPQAEAIRAASRLDTQGSNAEARAAFQKIIDEAPNPAARAAAQRRMALSWAFAGNCREAVRYEEMVIDYWKTREAAEPQNAFYQQGEMANEAARICIDAGDLRTAERMYKRGSELGLREPEPKTHPKSLWDFRLAHANARLAARRGRAADAARYVREARQLLDSDSTMRSQQERFYPYLVGYVALYTNDLATAETELSRAVAMPGNTTDPFLHALLGMTHEKKGEKAKAMPLYQKAYDLSTGHNPPAAFTRPFARKQLGAP